MARIVGETARSRVSGSVVAWSVGTILALLLATSAAVAATDKQAVHDDALVVMSAAIGVTTGALYCNKFVQPNPRLVEAAKQWNERHQAEVERVIQAIEWSGGQNDEEKDLMNKKAFEQWGELNATRCEKLRAEIESGALDLDKRPETSPALKRIMDSEIP